MSQAIPPNRPSAPSYWGEYRCELDAEGYLLLPKPLLETAEAAPLILTKGLDGCLLLAPQNYFSVLRKKVQALPFTDKLSRSFRRHLFASAMPASPDNQRRIFVPDRLREYANLTGTAIIVGNDAYLEIWNASHWADTQMQVADQLTHQGGWILEGV